MAQQVKDLAFGTAAAGVTAVVRVQSLAGELPHGMSVAEKKKKKNECRTRDKLGNRPSSCPLTVNCESESDKYMCKPRQVAPVTEEGG